MINFKANGIDPDQGNRLLDWAVQFGHASGNAMVLSDQQIIELGQAGIESYEQFSRNVWDTKTPNDLRASMPWLGLGLASDFDAGRSAWTKLVNSYSDAWYSMTGEHLNPVFDPNGANKGHDDFAKIYDAIRANQSPDAFVQAHRQDPGFLQKYPWVAQGMTYEQQQVYQVTSAKTLSDAYRAQTGKNPSPDQLKQWQAAFLSPSQLTQQVQEDPSLRAEAPWLAHGMSFQAQQQYRLETGAQMKEDFFKATGQQAGDDQIGTHLDKFQTPAQYQDFLHTDQKVLDTYGWLKYGLDYQGFKSQKEEFGRQFGRALTDEEALARIRDVHSFATGPTLAEAPPPAAGAQKKKAQVDVSLVR